MQSAPQPVNEAQRLEALQSYEVLDTMAEQAYDDITSIASHICGVPIALVSLVDADRQWFKSRHGLDAEQTPRDVAFCAHAILQPEELFVVEDAHEDERFHDNPLVTDGPHVRFYAGAPLVTADGMAMGTLCVIDHEARELSEQQARTLQSLARQVMAQLELRATLKTLEQKSRQLEISRQELERSNEDLERFAHVAAHDLKAPLRVIKGFAELLNMELAEQLAEDQQEYLQFIRTSADQGQTLIDDIMSYSGLAKKDPEPVDLNNIVQAIRENLERDSTSAQLVCQALPSVTGDPAQLKQLFDNLIRNGFKYNNSDAPRMEISVSTDDEGVTLAFADNGLGIAEEQHARVFEMFARAHSGADYEGTGIGLAICKRVMELHEGSIALTSTVGGGSTFSCTFPLSRIIQTGEGHAATVGTAR